MLAYSKIEPFITVPLILYCDYLKVCKSEKMSKRLATCNL